MRGEMYFVLLGFFSAIFGKVYGLSIPLDEQNQVDLVLPKVVGHGAENNSNKARQEGAVDSIEDAILAALEAAQMDLTTRPTFPTNRPRPDSVTLIPQYQPPVTPVQQQHLAPFGQFGIGGATNRFPIGHPGSLLPWVPIPALTVTGHPVEYINGIFGNVLGVADNTVKLVGSSSNALFGVADNLFGVAGKFSCTLNPAMCPNKG